MECIYLNMYINRVGMIGLGSWGKNIYRNLETFNVLKKIYDCNTENLNNTVTFKEKIANNADEIILSKDNKILEEQLSNLEKDILVLKNKVENDDFLKKAPPVVVEKFTKKMKQKLSLKNKILTQIKS